MDTIENNILDISKNDQVEIINYEIENEKARDKAKWCDVSDDFLKKLFIKFCNTTMKGEYKDNLDKEKLDFSGSNRDYYKKKFPKFDNNIINILCEIDKKNQEKINVSIE